MYKELLEALAKDEVLAQVVGTVVGAIVTTAFTAGIGFLRSLSKSMKQAAEELGQFRLEIAKKLAGMETQMAVHNRDISYIVEKIKEHEDDLKELRSGGKILRTEKA